MRRQVHDTGVDDRRRVVGAAGLEPSDHPFRAKRDADATCRVPDTMRRKPDRGQGLGQAPVQTSAPACHSADTAGRFAEHNISTTAEPPPDLRARITRIVGKRGGRGDER